MNAEIFFLPEGKKNLYVLWYVNIFMLNTYRAERKYQSEAMCKTLNSALNRCQNTYHHVKVYLTTSCLIISSLSLSLSCRQLIRCISSGLDSGFLVFSSNFLSLCQRKDADQQKFSLGQVQEILEL